MQKIWLFSSLLLLPLYSHAGFIQYFKDEDGNTKWQYVANFSSSVLIVALSIALITLFFSHRRQVKANRALNEIRNVLEQRVMERTATLDESNRLLRDANTALEGEIEKHRQTSKLLKQSEAYIKNILQSMPSMLIGLDGDLNITQWNRCAEEITGIDHAKALGSNLWEVYPTITIAPEQVKDVLVSGLPSTIKHSQRGQYYFDIRVFPLKGPLDRGVVILVDNVTQRTLAENMLIQRDKMSSMGELASTMVHDIATPLEAITNDLDTIKSHIENVTIDNKADVNELLSDASERSNQVSYILKNLLQFAQSHGDEKQLVPIQEIVAHSIELANTTLSDPKGLRFSDVAVSQHIEEGLPPIPCFVAELQQVFLSLFRHCIHALAKTERDDFSPEISVEIIECYDAMWIKIHHNGVGLDGEEQHNIFEPFVNTWPYKKTESLEAENRLSFTHFIITDHHQGQLAITSDVEVGTTFHIQLQLN